MSDNQDRQSESKTAEAIQSLRIALTEQRNDSDHFVFRLAKQLGVLAGAGAAVGLVAKALGASDSQVAAVSVAPVLCAYVIIYRDRIQNRVRVTWILVGLIAMLAIGTTFSGYLGQVVLGQTLTKATGIVEYAPRANAFLPRLHQLIRGAKDEVWFTGISFYISLPENRAELLAKLEEGVNVRFLIYSPLSKDLDQVAESFGQTREELVGELKITIENLRTLQAEAVTRKAKGELQVRLFSAVPKMRMYSFDRRSDEGLTFFIPHVDRQNSPTVPGFLAKNVPTGVVPPLLEGAERLWASSIPFDRFLQAFDGK